MLVDLHIHESKYSLDSHVSLEKIIEEAKRKGLDGIAITDHDDMQIKEEAETLSKNLNYPIFVGVEYLTLEGDIVAFGIDKVPEGRIPAQEFINLVNEAGGVCISAHPFRNNNRGLENNLNTIRGLAGIEGFNGNTDKLSNLKAFETAKKLGIQAVGSSDAHHQHAVGRFATKLPFTVTNVAELIRAIKTNECVPMIYVDGIYKEIEER
ncbi:PHP domain-containing protein [Cetobacterium somerae]|uniref:PHP domain-containing protein n=1 Tax=Cetobacterium somerae TaxID=188913 RepID=UPI00211E247F|nr:PHP domain-containing protein [Cetobacterium somerae]MCQ9628072.1 PHP domain-containing protein [Cetobacterium somerae]